MLMTIIFHNGNAQELEYLLSKSDQVTKNIRYPFACCITAKLFQTLVQFQWTIGNSLFPRRGLQTINLITVPLNLEIIFS